MMFVDSTVLVPLHITTTVNTSHSSTQVSPSSSWDLSRNFSNDQWCKV